MFSIAFFAAITELPQKLRHEPQREPDKNRGRDYREHHYRRNGVD
jgi:hypothetical protein